MKKIGISRRNPVATRISAALSEMRSCSICFQFPTGPTVRIHYQLCSREACSSKEMLNVSFPISHDIQFTYTNTFSTELFLVCLTIANLELKFHISVERFAAMPRSRTKIASAIARNHVLHKGKRCGEMWNKIRESNSRIRSLYVDQLNKSSIGNRTKTKTRNSWRFFCAWKNGVHRSRARNHGFDPRPFSIMSYRISHRKLNSANVMWDINNWKEIRRISHRNDFYFIHKKSISRFNYLIRIIDARSSMTVVLLSSPRSRDYVSRTCIIPVCHISAPSPSAKSREESSTMRNGNASPRCVHFHVRLSAFMSGQLGEALTRREVDRSYARTYRCQLFQFPLSTGDYSSPLLLLLLLPLLLVSFLPASKKKVARTP